MNNIRSEGGFNGRIKQNVRKSGAIGTQNKNHTCPTSFYKVSYWYYDDTFNTQQS